MVIIKNRCAHHDAVFMLNLRTRLWSAQIAFKVPSQIFTMNGLTVGSRDSVPNPASSQDYSLCKRPCVFFPRRPYRLRFSSTTETSKWPDSALQSLSLIAQNLSSAILRPITTSFISAELISWDRNRTTSNTISLLQDLAQSVERFGTKPTSSGPMTSQVSLFRPQTTSRET